MANEIKRQFKLKKNGYYNGGDDEIIEWIIDQTTNSDGNGYFMYNGNYEVTVTIKKEKLRK